MAPSFLVPVAGVDVLSLRETTTSCCRSSCTCKHATGMFAWRCSPRVRPPYLSQNQRKTRQGKPVWSFLVPVAGVEPARCHHHWILSPPRLPIPTHRRLQRSLYNRIQDLFKEKFDIWLCTKIYFVFVMSIFHKGIFCGQNGVGDQTDTSSNCNRNFTCFLGNSKKTCFWKIYHWLLKMSSVNIYKHSARGAQTYLPSGSKVDLEN